MDQENMVVVSDENNGASIKPRNVQGGAEMDGRKFGMEGRQNRRVLSVINQNLGAHPYPCVVRKKELSERTRVGDKNPGIPANRPITRKFAAQISDSQQQHCHEENKKPRTVADDDELRVLVDDEGGDKDQPVPMALEHTEVVSNEKTQIEEVEVEDIFEDAVLDIDSGDARNPLAVVEYIEDLYAYYRKMENSSCVSPDYMANQPDINERMRAILIDWLIEVHHKFELREETLFVTVNLIDRFLEKQGIVRKKLQLVGLVAMLLACKYEEVAVPIVDDLVIISDKAYTKQEVLDMESCMLNTLQFNMSVPTPYVFLRRFLKATQADKKLELLSFFLIELCLVEYKMLELPPSTLAAAAVYTAQCSLHCMRQWNQTCEWHTGYSEDQLLESSRMMVSLHQKAATGKLTGVYRKYSISRFGGVAKCEPATFLLIQE
nr:G2/mitotic-specific cyclin-2-like [Ipomoea batatas]